MMKVVPYDPKYRQDFIEMNRAWISEMFRIEEQDLKEMDNVDSAIEAGGRSFLRLTIVRTSWPAAWWPRGRTATGK